MNSQKYPPPSWMLLMSILGKLKPSPQWAITWFYDYHYLCLLCLLCLYALVFQLVIVLSNFQDSTFSLAGGYGPEELQGSPKRAVRVNAPPGGGMSKGSFWWRSWRSTSTWEVGKLTGHNLGWVFSSRCGRACLCYAIMLLTKTAKLKVENSAQTTFRFSPISFGALGFTPSFVYNSVLFFCDTFWFSFMSFFV
jgi:hypothetical protein